jgi:hypothetical protein
MSLKKIPTINEVWKKATLLVNTLRNALKQYAYPRLQQEIIYGEMKALIAKALQDGERNTD